MRSILLLTLIVLVFTACKKNKQADIADPEQPVPPTKTLREYLVDAKWNLINTFSGHIHPAGDTTFITDNETPCDSDDLDYYLDESELMVRDYNVIRCSTSQVNDTVTEWRLQEARLTWHIINQPWSTSYDIEVLNDSILQFS